MATTEEIQLVQQMLGPDASTEGWPAERIEQDLDADMTAEQIALSYWRFRMASTSNYVDVTESGSSRKLSDIYNNALKMVTFYQKRVDDMDPTVQGRTRLRPLGRA